MSGIKEDKRAYSQSRTILGNLGIFLWIVLGTVAVWFFNPIYAGIFFFLAIIMVFAVVRRSLCKTCAYCKKCTMGSNKLSELAFGKAELGGLSANALLSRLIAIYGLLTVVPIAFLAASISQEYVVFKIVVLVALLLVSFFSILTKRKREFMKN
jgi:hypothetical protein